MIAYLVRSNIVVDAYATFACGALAGAIAATLTTPADVAKTFRQIELGRTKYSPKNVCATCSSTSIQQPLQSTKTLTILLHILRVEGPKGLFAGSYFSSENEMSLSILFRTGTSSAESRSGYELNSFDNRF